VKRAFFLVCFLIWATVAVSQSAPDAYLQWSQSQCESVGIRTNVHGRVGSMWHERGLKTEQAIYYKLVATWFTPEVIRASARCAQLKSHLSDEETRKLVEDAEAVGGTVVMLELDPNEGSGVIPSDWEAFLGPKSKDNANQATARGNERPDLRKAKLFAGVLRRNYDYDRFWVVFPLVRENGVPLFDTTSREAELTVRVNDQSGKVVWSIPEGIRERTSALETQKNQPGK
jgi:hypothetical protein